ncbi:probable hexosyltransferase MUCI70 [Lactuca sativa]|uniref:probable hexosyltransferase MUCI70 n=1 Tax=Lactuca sativa TaxID=4236 RepID=UPI000CA9F86E|nr:probable hexosyltransferase MUCI70 [Lactuca sativa]
MFNNSVSIPVTDDLPDEFGGKMRSRPRRKRRKSEFRGKSELANRTCKQLTRWWPVLLFVAAVLLLVFEASKLGWRSSTIKSDLDTREKKPNVVVSPVKKSEGNLNRLDAPRCLKLLPPEELEHLDFPHDKDSFVPIKKLVYISQNDTPFDKTSQQEMGITRFNQFTGYQTLNQRDQSFKVNETACVHCGFYSEAGGFTISKEDKSFMNSCKSVVSTCTFGGGDDLHQPIGMSDASLQKVCYVAFWDETTLATQEAQGHVFNKDGFIGKWRIVIVRNLPFRDQRLNGKIPKMLAHRLFPNARYSIWVDSKSQFRRDPLGVFESLLWRSKSVFAISEHGARSSVYDEAKAVVKKNKATPEEVEIQITQYTLDGLPQDKRFNGKKALNEASVIVREHTSVTNLFMCLWFNEVVRFTSRDQLSFPYVLWRVKVLKNINMFPVCIRKDLVNSMGHLRKAKPLALGG